jgi:proteasome lid subunit RPN8/RPN11
VLTIDQATYDAIVAHAKRDHPDEACGIVAGPEGSDRPSGSSRWSTPRAARRSTSSTRPTCSRSTRRWTTATRSRWSIYHSHTATEAYPSRTDIGLASEPNAHYVLVSTREHGNNEGPVEFRSYRIIDGEVTEEEVTSSPKLDESP